MRACKKGKRERKGNKWKGRERQKEGKGKEGKGRKENEGN